jgi:hypothetical protein
METVLIILTIILLAYNIKALIDINASASKILKEVKNAQNNLKKLH